MIVSPLTNLLKTVRFFSFKIPEKSEGNRKPNRTYDSDEKQTGDFITITSLKKIG